jgi:hypothetical protein
VVGVSGRTRIKQAFTAAGAVRTPVFPTKWGLDVPPSPRISVSGTTGGPGGRRGDIQSPWLGGAVGERCR